MRFKIALILCVVFWSVSTKAQTLGEAPIEIDKPAKSIYLKTNPLALVQGPIPFYSSEARIGFEGIASDHLTYQGSAGYIFLSPIFNALIGNAPGVFGGNLRMPGYRFQGEVRYYYIKLYNKKKLSEVFLPSGLYVGLNASYASADFKARDIPIQKIDFTQININVIGGAQLMYNDLFGLDVFAGLGYKNNIITYYDFNGKKEIWTPADVGLGDFYAYPINVKLGMNLTFGLL
jgi:hypothetical protein